MVNNSIPFQHSKFESVIASIRIYMCVYVCMCTCMYICVCVNDVSELTITPCCTFLSQFQISPLLVKEKAKWLFLSRNQSLRKRYMEHFLEASHCLQNGIIHHNITGKISSGSLFLSQV